MMLRTVFPVLTTFMVHAGLAANTARADEVFYISDGVHLHLVHGTTTQMSVEQWAAYYFKKDSPSNLPSRAWGMATARTAEAVLRHVESDQKFERHFEKWCGCSWGTDTFFNVVAPVALILKPVRDGARTKKIVETLHSTGDRLKGLIDMFNSAADLAGENRLPGLSGPFADFVQALHKGIDRFLMMKKDLTQFSDVALNQLEDRLNEFGSTLDGLAHDSTTVFGSPNAPQTSQTGPQFRFPLDYGGTVFATQTFQVTGNQLTYERHYERTDRAADANGSWNQYSISFADVHAKFEGGRDQVWATKIFCRANDACLKMRAGDDSSLKQRDRDRVYDWIYFPSEGEARAFEQNVNNR
jgi:hypothetical protein